ncbi:2-phospho-L-lactate guanylyltransferase [Acidobacteria bacterium AH-259-A15]|nr:2-phospho-L-lactate guanylyltransferase [Acidobacteria bacterium AH-259-A15]
MKVVLLPVKDPVHAKQRLANYLSPGERQELDWAMLQDVSRALRAATKPDRIVVVTCSKSVLRHAVDNGWQVIEEKEQISESQSVDVSSQLLLREGASVLLCLPGDIPLLDPKDVDLLLSFESEPGSAVIVPSRDGTGTNALLRTPPDAFSSRFGKNSFFRHQQEARRRGVKLRVTENPRISLDLDELSDLLHFIRLDGETRTAEVLKRFDSLSAILKSK